MTFPMASFAVQVCVKNASEYAEKKAQIPKVLQKLQEEPAIFAGKDWKAAAAIKIYFTESGLKLDANVVPSIGSAYFDSSHIKNVCFEDDVITVTGNNNASFEVKVKSESSVYFKGMTFSATSPAQFAALADQVTKASSDKVSSKANSNNNGGTH
ncbi:MAG: hypothetical protein HUU57_11290 [Bdellovibrio sp.]|nr:hypothetical protein [Bdellovibrio sp.]